MTAIRTGRPVRCDAPGPRSARPSRTCDGGVPVDAAVGDRLAVVELPERRAPGARRRGTTRASRRRSRRCRRRSGRRRRRRRPAGARAPCRCCRARRRSSRARARPAAAQQRERRARPPRRRSSEPPCRRAGSRGSRGCRACRGSPACRRRRSRRTRGGAAAARTASTATWTLPSVRFLKPTGIDRPDPSWRWIWLSVVRAPIAPQQTASEMYCGVIGSRNSQPTGRPSASTSSSSRARHPQARVDVAGAVEVRIVDQPLPAGRRPRLLEVDAHRDAQRRSAACAACSLRRRA